MGGELARRLFDGGRRDTRGLGLDFPQLRTMIGVMNEDLDRIEPRESAHARARDRKTRGPKVVAGNPGLKKLALHLADKRRATAEPKDAAKKGRRRPP